MAKTRPESWIGEIVIVALSIRNPKEFTGRLDEVNDRGIVLSLNPDSMNAVEAFYPWAAVRRLRLRSKREEMEPRTGPELGKRLPGDPGWFS
ncbi:MAG: hypothetical protein WA982_08875 [Rubrobacteraceae bacterium]